MVAVNNIGKMSDSDELFSDHEESTQPGIGGREVANMADECDDEDSEETNSSSASNDLANEQQCTSWQCPICQQEVQFLSHKRRHQV